MPRIRLGRWLIPRGVVAIAVALTLAPSLNARAAESAVVLVYQRFGETKAHAAASVSLAQFEAHLAHLKRGGFTVLPLPELVLALRERRPLPERSVAITIDNGFASALREAWPRLSKVGFPVTLFVATDAIDAREADAMSWSELKALAAAGVTIGSRGARNRPLWRLDQDELRKDIERANARFKAELGAVPKLFAYPSGEFDDAVKATVRSLGFDAAFSLYSGPAHVGSDLLALPRFELSEPYAGADRFALIADTLPLPSRDVVPEQPVIRDASPRIGFTIDESVGALDELACFASRVGRVSHETSAERRVVITLDQPFRPGHDNRINCTLPAAEGRFRWLGLQYVVP